MKRAAPCVTCPQRTWRSLHGFMVMGCGVKGLRFGIAPDIAKGRVNKAGGCVAMPRECASPYSPKHQTPSVTQR
jgi:hypothetical protein